MGTSQLVGFTPNAADVVGVFSHAAAILLLVSYMRLSGEKTVIPLLALTSGFKLTGRHKVVHLCTLLTVIGVEIFYWYDKARYTDEAGLFVAGFLLSLFASGPI